VNIDQLIASVRAAMAPKLEARKAKKTELEGIRSACAAESREPNETEAATITARLEEIRGLDAELSAQSQRITELEDEKRRDEAADALAREVHPTGAGTTAAPADRAGGTVARIGQEPRTFRVDNDPKGIRFLSQVASMALSGRMTDELARHMQEETVERGQQFDRAAGTGAFTGLVVPQYLTDMVAPLARAGRPFADACRHHDMPEQGMTVNIGRVTTGTLVDDQSAENAAVSEQDIDDTLLTLNVSTNAGQQTLSRQAVERGQGVEDTTLEDLYRAYAVSLDTKLLNKATIGLTNVATAITYTSASPTPAEFYPKTLGGPAAVEAALLDQAAGDVIAVMHSRRWYWLQAGLSSTWPLFGQPGTAPQLAGVNFGEKYGSGFRGVLPNGTPVIVDNNVATNLGAGTNQDEVYFVSQSESHLWEDPNAPMLIRAEQAKAANLGILLVVYGYYAFTAARRPHVQKISGTGLVTPTF
jgi:hypothetical protein